MNNKFSRETIRVFTVSLLLLSIILGYTSPVLVRAQEEVPRDKTLWGTGYHPHPTAFVPIVMDWGQGWDTYIMYEPVFGTDVANGELIPWLGESIEWVDGSDGTEIEVKLREGIHWSDGEPITADDVEFSYYLYGAFSESPDGKYWHMGAFQTRVGSMSNFEIVDARTYRVHILPAYAYSSVVWRQMTQSFLIVPEHVWSEIEDEYEYIPDFANDWTDAETPEDWKVASGMYLPYWHDQDRTIMKRNDDWWGKDVSDFGRLPVPEYFGYITFDTNPPAANALEAGEIDWCGKYVPGITGVQADHPNIHTYFNDAPYFADKSTKLLVPNQRRYPLNEPWFRKAITHVLDFDAFNAITSNYLKPPSPLLIPADDEIAKALLNEEIEDKYRIDYNVTKALAILNEYCIKVDGTWYTKDGPSDDYLDTYEDVNVSDYIVDALPDESGINVPLGPYDLIDVYGWTDTNAIDVYAADQISSLLGISVNAEFPDFGTYVTRMDTMDFDFCHYVMHYGLNSDMFQRYDQALRGAVGCWSGNYGDYRNATLDELLDDLDTVQPGSTEEQQIADEIQEIVGSELPIIPLAGHPDWYIYSNQYWSGWPNEDNNGILAASPYGGSSQVANLHQIIFNLQEAGAVPTGGLDMTLIVGGAIVGVVVIVILAILYSKRK